MFFFHAVVQGKCVTTYAITYCKGCKPVTQQHSRQTCLSLHLLEEKLVVTQRQQRGLPPPAQLAELVSVVLPPLGRGP